MRNWAEYSSTAMSIGYGTLSRMDLLMFMERAIFQNMVLLLWGR